MEALENVEVSLISIILDELKGHFNQSSSSRLVQNADFAAIRLNGHSPSGDENRDDGCDTGSTDTLSG